jgi:hypothetical protein
MKYAVDPAAQVVMSRITKDLADMVVPGKRVKSGSGLHLITWLQRLKACWQKAGKRSPSANEGLHIVKK